MLVMSRWRTVAATAAVVALVGCSGGASKPDASNTLPSETTTTTNPAVSPADQALAQRLALSLSDFPPGWTSKPHEDKKNAKADEELNACLKLPGTKLIPDAANADSPDFTSSSDQRVSNAVAVTKSRADVTKALDVLASADIGTCFSRYLDTVLKESATSDAKIGKASVSPESFDSLGDRTVALRATVPVTTKGLNVNVYADIVVVQKGRVAILLTAEDTFTPFPTDMSATLIGKVLARMPANA